MFVHKVLFEFLEFKHPRLLLVSPSDMSTGGGLLGVKFLAMKTGAGEYILGVTRPNGECLQNLVSWILASFFFASLWTA